MLWIIVLYLAGIMLFLAEFLIPGMISGIIGSVMIVVSMFFVARDYPDSALIIIVLQFLGIFAAVIAGMYMLPKSRLSRRLILSDSQQAESGWVSADSVKELLGAQGTVYTALRPAGTIVVNGKRYDAVANGSFIDKDKQIRVIEVHGSRVVVEEAGNRETTSQPK